MKMRMTKFGVLLSALACLCLVVPALSTDAEAQTLVPCCEGGAKPNKRCKSDDNCPGICRGGSKDGKQCRDSFCPSACVGGGDDGKGCESDADCSAACAGGSKDGKKCDEDRDCPGGSCADVGTCSDLGVCLEGACTGMCPTGKKPKSPSDMASHGLDLDDDDTPPVSDAGETTVATRPPCP